MERFGTRIPGSTLPQGRLIFFAAFVFALVSSSLCLAAGRPQPEALTPAAAQALVARALATEVREASDSSHPMRYTLHKVSPRVTTTKQIVETHDGGVALLVAVNDQPLDPLGQQQEQQRLDALRNDPSLQQHRKHNEGSDMGIVLKVLRMMPTAFVYQYTGVGQGPDGVVQKFSFKPKPGFQPPDMETQALTAMTGELWVDAAEERVVRLAGSLQQDTSYGWGILGKLNKGGWIELEQSEVAPHLWRIRHVQLKMTLRIVVKTKVFDTDELMTGYAAVPREMDYRAAIRLLRGR